MSAFAIIQKPDAVHMLTDAAVYTPDGGFIRAETKVVQLPAARTAMCVRGAGYAQLPLPLLLAEYLNFDQVIAELPSTMKAIVDYAESIARDLVEPHQNAWEMVNFEVTVVGWSHSLGRPVAVLASTSEANDPRDMTGLSGWNGYEPFRPFILPAIAASNISLEAAAAIVQNDDIQDIADVDPLRHGVAMMNLMRQQPTAKDGRIHNRYTVGGFVELTTITRDNMAVMKVLEWPDVPGTEIRPDLDHVARPLAAAPPSLSIAA